MRDATRSAHEHNALADEMRAVRSRAKLLTDSRGYVGFGICELRDESDRVWDTILEKEVGRLKDVVGFANTITDAGDLYYAGMGIALVSPAAPAQPTKVLGMAIGTGSTAVNKAASTGIAITTFLVGQAFDASFPALVNLGVNTGVNMQYKTTYAAGTGTGTITEAVIQNTTIASAALAAATISRTVFTGIVKGASDSLAITWNHKNLGT